ncbi:MAG: SagB/ThcOx family dehydrogenase [Sedimentisphaerales bacterium]|nr:SagB/ThcOx family dehydrogenase [Sedimentisphaerales bacterium]
MSDVGDTFQMQTKYRRGKLGDKYLDWSKQPQLYKTYEPCKKIPLPRPADPQGKSLTEIIKHRRSIRNYIDEPISLEALSYLLWAAGGITHRQGEWEFRAAPSAGALYPIETYVVINRVNNLEQGVYHYGIRRHELELIKPGNFRHTVAQAALDQGMCSEAAVVFIWTAIFQRSKWKYDQRAYRYIYLDAGHIAAHLSLAAVDLNLASCQIAALYDDEVNALINVDGKEESTLYMTVVGVPAKVLE